jgi:hypothetical protein
MQKTHIKNPAINNSLVLVTAKEQGKLYEIKGNTLQIIDYVAEHPPEYSDNEGYFMRSGGGELYGSGNPREEDDKANLDRFINAIEQEASEALKRGAYERILVIEPEHLKGKVAAHINNPSHLPVEVVACGNYVQHDPNALAELLDWHNNEQLDPADPASVAGEENAEEKRKILETAELLRNQS